MKLKVIKRQWSYSADLAGDLELANQELKELGALNIVHKVIATDQYICIAITYNEAEPTTREVIAPKKK